MLGPDGAVENGGRGSRFSWLPVAPAYFNDTEKNIFDHDNCINSRQWYKNNENIWALFSTLLSLPCWFLYALYISIEILVLGHCQHCDFCQAFSSS